MRDINRKVWQFQDAAETEMKAWRVDTWPNGCMVTRFGTAEEMCSRHNERSVRTEQEQFRDEAGLKAIGAI